MFKLTDIQVSEVNACKYSNIDKDLQSRRRVFNLCKIYEYKNNNYYYSISFVF